MVFTHRCAWTFRQIGPADRVVQCTGCGRYYLKDFVGRCVGLDCFNGRMESVAGDSIPQPTPEPAQTRVPLPPVISNRLNSINDRPLGISEDVLLFEAIGPIEAILRPQGCRITVCHNPVHCSASYTAGVSGTNDSSNAETDLLELSVSNGPLWLAFRPITGPEYTGETVELLAGQQADYDLAVHLYRPPETIAYIPIFKNSGLHVLVSGRSLPIHLLQCVTWYLIGVHVWAVVRQLESNAATANPADTFAVLVAWAVLLTPQLLLRTLLGLRLGAQHRAASNWVYDQAPLPRLLKRGAMAASVGLFARLFLPWLWKIPVVLQGPSGEPMALVATAVVAVVASVMWQAHCGINWLAGFPGIFRRRKVGAGRSIVTTGPPQPETTTA
jgi:hypothetical protein